MAAVTQSRRSALARALAGKPQENKIVKRAPANGKAPAYLQAKLAMSSPGDASEQEAERVAKQVARSPRGAAARAVKAGALATPASPSAPTRQATAAAPAVQRASVAPGVEPPVREVILPVPAAQQIQRASAAPGVEETPVQRASVLRAADEPSAVSASAVGEATEQRIEARRGGGSPLSEQLRAEMEGRFARDFADVRVHTDSEAQGLCAETGARAFTVGNDIFFAPGEFDPASDGGRELLAHELTHVVQQEHTARRLQRNGTPPPASSGGAAAPATGSGATDFALSDGTLLDRVPRRYPGSDTDRKRLQLPEVSLPTFKERNSSRFPNVLALRPGARGVTRQSEFWRESVRSSVSRLLEAKKDTARISGGYHRDSDTYFLRARRNPEFVLFGTSEQILEANMVPFWDENGRPSSYQIDHVVEDQLVNPDDTSYGGLSSADRASNFELLDASANGSSGTRLNAEIDRRLRRAVSLFASEYPGERPLQFEALRRWGAYYVNFLSHPFDLGGTGGNPQNFWSHRSILRGEALNVLDPMTGDQMRRLNREDEPVVFTSTQGGVPRYVRQSALPIRNWLPRVNLTGIEITPNPATAETAGWLTVSAYGAEDARAGAVAATYPEMRWRLRPVPGMYGGAIDAEYIKENYFGARSSLQLPGLSPISFDSLSLSERGLRAEGRVLPTVPFVGNADIRILVTGAEIQLRKTFQGSELTLPPPFALKDTSLAIFFSSERGLGVEGRADFEVSRLGQGYLEAAATTGRGFELAGGFDFDSQLFDRAGIEMWYRAEQFGAAGDLAITSPNKIRGIHAASLHIDYQAGRFNASGSVDPDIPGVQQAGLRVEYSEAEGLLIGGNLRLSANPAIRSGSMDVTVRKLEDTWRVAATGTAQPAIPGLNSDLAVSYDDGAFNAAFRGTFQRGMLSGTVEAGATNRTLDGSGQPTGPAAPDATIIVYGSGSATLQIAPWLQGTAGIRFAPNGEVTVSGEIGLPASLQIFPRREIRRTLLDMATQIPFFPGIVAEVGGNLSAQAGIGPGALDQLRIGIEYNPAHEENTHITGDARFNVPADAGVRLGARAGIGLGITGASATGGLELGGTLGIAGAAEAGVHIDWMPARGLQVDAEGYLHAEPRFRFDVSGYVSVRALGFSVYDNRWELAAYELGSNLRLGVRFPIHYRQGQPFDVSLDDVQFEVPDIDPMQLVRDLGDRIF